MFDFNSEWERRHYGFKLINVLSVYEALNIILIGKLIFILFYIMLCYKPKCRQHKVSLKSSINGRGIIIVIDPPEEYSTSDDSMQSIDTSSLVDLDDY